ncbi:hypothetical protein [Caldifermentibacillus hisashii]|uniref:hypothetical protein n=1 Tax=Caldifermentibacillus hisashii TaxID=996558 RepID=UPI0034D7321D
MATKPFLVVVLRRETPFFGDETPSHSHKENSAIAEPLGESRAVVHRKNIKFFGLRCIPVKFSLCTYT